jgi:tRNA G26 N,N-dimethylase Trm1
MMEYIGKEQFKLPLATKKKIYGVLHGIVAEGELAKIPLGFNFDLMNKTVHSTGFSKQNLLNAVKSLGKDYQIASSYLSPGIYKTTLPFEGVYDIIKSWKLK